MYPETTPLRGFAMPGPNSVPSSIVRPPIEANNFQFNLGLITLFQQEQFGGSPFENSNTHISSFLKKCDTIKMNAVSNDVIHLRLFPFSLKDKAKSWLLNSNANSFTTWKVLSKAFLCKYFLLGKTAKLRNDITSFYQAEGESLYEAWERFKKLQRDCPHHGIPDWLLIRTFYNGLQQPMKISIDAAVGGALMAKPINKAKQLSEDMASNKYHWGNE